MKIGIFDPYLDTMSGGEKYMLSIALSLSENHDVNIFWDIKSSKDIIDKAQLKFGYDLSKIKFTPSIFNRDFSFFSRYELSRQFDLIILLSDGSIPIVGCPLILHFQSPMNWINGRNLKDQLKLTRVKKIVVNSKYTKGYIDKTFSKKSIVLYPPVTIQRKYDPVRKVNKILNVGRFGINQAGSSFKKQDILADAFVKMCDKDLLGWELIFVMSLMEKDSEAFELFKKKYSSYPIRFLTNPSNSDLWDEYQSASIYWHASGFEENLKEHPDRAEHFGISTVEAMGAGAVPVVISLGGQKEIVIDNKNGRLWETVLELKQQTLELVQDKVKLKILAEQGVRDAEIFSFAHFSSQINDLIK